MLLRVGNATVTPVPPQLVAEVLDAVGLCLRTNFALRRENSRGEERTLEEIRGENRKGGERTGEGRREEGSCLCRTYIEPLTATLLTASRGFILHSFLVPKVKLTTEHRGLYCAEIAGV